MQKFRTLAAFFLLEKQQPQKERNREEEEEKMPSTMATSALTHALSLEQCTVVELMNEINIIMFSPP